jgi:dipeptidyl aminopeptidase/acylaminoacyl peptidase
MNKKLSSTLLLAVLSSCLFAQDKNTIKPGENLIIDGIPPLSTEIAQEVKRYTESRGAGFADWHPDKMEMLISTRFGNTNQVHLVKFAGGDRKQITFFDEPVNGGSYDPVDGKYFIFGRDVGGNEFAQLYRYDFADGKITLLTDGKRSQNGGVQWSSDGKKIAYASTSRNGADRDIYITDPMNPTTTKMVLQVEGGGWGIADWSPDDKQLIIEEGISVNESHLWMLNMTTGEKSELTPRKETGVAYNGAFYSKDGKGIYIVSDKDYEFQRLAFMDLSTKKINYLTSDLKWDVDGTDLSDDGKYLLFATNEAGSSRLYLMETATGKYKPIEGLPTGVIGNFEWHKNNDDVAINFNSARSTTDVYVWNRSSGKLTRWTESELGGIVASELSEPSLIKWKSFDGLEISGFYYKPHSKFTGKRPVIINIHGGPEGQSFPTFMGRNNYLLNELGVAIILPNVRGSTGFGKNYVKLDNGKLRENSVKDIGALIDWIAKQPDLDASRIMVTGGSYGGYMTLAVATNYNDKIRCALDVVGISNFVTFLQNTESYRRDLRRVEYGDERDPKMKEFLEKISPTNNASKISKPLFIVQGGNDPRVPRTEASQMAATVKKNNSPVWYLEAKDEGHGFRKKNNVDFQFYATVQFIKMYLINP